MRIRQICQRCGRKYSEIQIHGEGGERSALFSMMGIAKRCPQCGGRVRSVQEGQVLVGEFRISPWRLIKGGVLSAWGWVCFSLILAMAAQDMSKVPTNEGLKEIQVNLLTILPIRLAMVYFLVGIVLLLIAAFLASRHSDLDEPTSPGAMPFGQAASMMPILVLGIVMSLMISVWLIPVITPPEIHLRSILHRAILGGVLGLVASSFTHRMLFKMCRLRLPDDSIQNY